MAFSGPKLPKVAIPSVNGNDGDIIVDVGVTSLISVVEFSVEKEVTDEIAGPSKR